MSFPEEILADIRAEFSGAATIDELVEWFGETPRTLSAALARLEADGRVNSENGRYSIPPSPAPDQPQSPTELAQLPDISIRAQMETPMTAKPDAPAMPPVKRTSAGLRDILFDEIDAMRNGTSNPTRGNAVARLVTGVVETVTMEMEVAKFAGLVEGQVRSQSPAVGLPNPIHLGG